MGDCPSSHITYDGDLSVSYPYQCGITKTQFLNAYYTIATLTKETFLNRKMKKAFNDLGYILPYEIQEVLAPKGINLDLIPKSKSFGFITTEQYKTWQLFNTYTDFKQSKQEYILSVYNDYLKPRKGD
jgi:hypothetical protein